MHHIRICVNLVCFGTPLEDVWSDIGEALDRLSEDIETMVEMDNTIQATSLESRRTFHGEWIMSAVPICVVKVPQ